MDKSKSFLSSESTILLVLLFLSLFTLLNSFLLFHITVELFSIVIAFAIFVFGWNGRHYINDGALLIVAVGFLAVGIIDMLHTLSYKGMNIFADDPNLATQLWILGRFVQVGAFFTSSFFIGKSIDAYRVVAVFALISASLLMVVFYGYFPDCFVEGEGLTPFKIASEYLIIALLIATMYRYNNSLMSDHLKKFIRLSLAFAVLAELSFTLYIDVYGISNTVGHIFKVIFYYLIYRSIIVVGFTTPMDILLVALKQSEEINRKNSEILAQQARFSGAAEAISNIANHWKQPLSVITISLQDIRDLFLQGNLTNEDLDESFNRSMQAINKIAMQVEGIKSQYKGALELKSEQLSTSVDTALDLLKEEIKAYRIVVARDFSPVFVQTYHNELIQVVVNILKNSIEAFSERLIPKPTIAISIKEIKGAAIITIADNAGGIAKEIERRVFEPYTTTKHKAFGVGLGLYMSKLIVEEHLKGKISAISQRDGTAVKIEISSIRG